MFYRRPRRSVPEINASSTADIAFLLLIFFLLTTSMDTDRGLPRRLPPPGDKTEAMKLKERNVLPVDLEGDDRVKCAGEYVDVRELRERAKLFIANPQDDPDLPERVPEEIPFLGTVPVTKHHVIALRSDRESSYRAYVSVQEALAGAYRDLRDELARRKWQCPYADLTPDRQEAVRRVFPQKISEVKPETDKEE